MKLAAARCVVVLVVVGMALLTTHGTAMGDAGEANKQLVAAARAGDAEAVRRLLAQGADPNTVDRITPLMAASTRFEKGQRLDIMRQLLAAGARVNDQADTGETALTFAARFRDADAIQLLLDNGADPNIVNQSGISPLLEAMRWGASKQEQLEMVQRLLARGANPNARGTGVGTPLSWAVRQNSLAMVRLLLDHRADPNLPDHIEATPLMRAVSRQNLGPDTVAIVQILVDAGADVNARDPFGDTPYSIAASTGNLAMLPLLERLGAKDASADSNRPSSLTKEVRAGHLAEVRLMLASGTDPNIPDGKSWTPLHYAANSGKAEIVEALVSAGARVNVRSKKGWTPLSLAVLRRHTPIVRRLLAAGADVTGKNGAGDPLIISAAHFNLHSSEPEIVQALLDAGADPNARDRDGLTPLMWAAAMGPPDLVALLLRRGADANAKTPDGITAWQLAVGDDVIHVLRQARGVQREKLGGARQ